MNLFKLFGSIVIENAEANKAIDGTTDKAADAEQKLESSFSKIGRYVTNAGKVITAGFAVGATTLTKLLSVSLDVSGRLEQGLGGAKAVYGEFAKSVEANAKAAFSTMGLSMADYLETANKMGSLFIGTGADIESAYEMTTNSMQRAADVAAIMGIDINWAMESVAGMAKGNYTMMDNLGVAMNDTTLKAYALEKGFEGSWKEMEVGQKVAFAYQMFMERTAYAMGQYTKENETYTGSITTMKAALQNLLSGETDAEALMPAIENGLRVAVDRIAKLAPVLAEGISALIDALLPHIGPILEKLVPAFTDFTIKITEGVLMHIINNIGDWMSGGKQTEEETARRVYANIAKQNDTETVKGQVLLMLERGENFDEQVTKQTYYVEAELQELITAGEYEEAQKLMEWWAGVQAQLNFTAPLNIVPTISGGTTSNGLLGGLSSLIFGGSSDALSGIFNSGDNLNRGRAGGFATGLDYVPRDNFLARLHQGEAVLTAKENSEYRRMKNGGNIESAIVYLTEAISELQAGFQANMNLYVNKKHVASALSRDMGRSIGNREYALMRGMGG